MAMTLVRTLLVVALISLTACDDDEQPSTKNGISSITLQDGRVITGENLEVKFVVGALLVGSLLLIGMGRPCER